MLCKDRQDSIARAGEKSQCIKYLLHKPKDPNSSPRTNVKEEFFSLTHQQQGHVVLLALLFRMLMLTVMVFTEKLKTIFNPKPGHCTV